MSQCVGDTSQLKCLQRRSACQLIGKYNVLSIDEKQLYNIRTTMNSISCSSGTKYLWYSGHACSSADCELFVRAGLVWASESASGQCPEWGCVICAGQSMCAAQAYLCNLPHLQAPPVRRPARDVERPCPCWWPSRHWPSYRRPSGHAKTPWPCFQLQR